MDLTNKKIPAILAIRGDGLVVIRRGSELDNGAKQSREQPLLRVDFAERIVYIKSRTDGQEYPIGVLSGISLADEDPAIIMGLKIPIKGMNI